MALDLKPLTEDVIQTMGYGSHDLWLVRVEAEVYGPFEVASLTDYATENGKEFIHAQASLMDANNWKPFFSYEHFKPIAITEEKVSERFWILDQGQKVGPITFTAVQKKIETGLLTLTDEVSTDEGQTWIKFLQLPAFNPGIEGGADSLPKTPLESSFTKAKAELNEWMESHESTGSHSDLAGLMFMGQKSEKPSLNLEEIDLKSLNETEVSRSLKWAIPSAVAGLGVLVALGNYLLSPMVHDISQAEESPEVIMPRAIETHAAMPTPRAYNPTRMPASYRPQEHQRSALTAPPVINSNAYPIPTHTIDHAREQDPVNENEQMDNGNGEGQEHNLVSNKPMNIGMPPSDQSLDQAMSGGVIEGDPEALPAGPVIEEAADF